MEGKILGADAMLWLGDLVEQPGRLVNPVLANMQKTLLGIKGPALAEGGRVHDPALAPDSVQRENLVQRDAKHLVVVEPTRRLVERLMWTQVVVAEGKHGASLVLPEPLNPEYVHVVGGYVLVDGLVGGIVGGGQGCRFFGGALDWAN